MTEGLKAWTEEEVETRRPEWIGALVTWLASPQSRAVSGRVFDAWGRSYGAAESWQRGPTAPASKDPTELGERIGAIVRYACADAGIDLNTWLDP